METGRVLIVEDEAIVALELRERVESLGFVVSGVANSGEEAIRLHDESHPDLVLLDVNLRGGMDGVETGKRIRERSDVPIVLATAYADPETVSRTKVLEPEGFLIKPFDERSIRATLTTTLFRRRIDRERQIASERVRAAERRMAKLTEKSGDVVIVVDVDGTAQYVGNSIVRVLGVAPVELLGRSFASIAYPDDLPTIRKIHEDLLSRPGESVTFEVRAQHRNGRPTWVEAIATNLVADPDVGGVVITFRDISARRLSDERLRASEAMFQALAAASPVGIFRADAHGNQVYVNERWCELTGLTSDEAMGKGWLRAFPPEDRGGRERAWMEGVRERRVMRQELAIERPDGTRIWVLAQAIPEIDVDEERAGFVGSITDLTDRKRMEEALGRSERSLSEAQRIAQIGSWDWDVVGNDLRWSDEVYRIFGLVPREFGATYEAFLDRVHPEDVEAVRDAVNLSFLHGAPYSIEHRVIRPDGTQRIVRERGETFFGGSGKPVRMLGTVQDITRDRHLEAQLQHARRMEAIGTLAGGIAHDFNNILMAILNFSELLCMSLPEGDEQDYAKQIMTAANRATALIAQILASSRVREGGRRPVDIVPLIHESLDLLSAGLSSRVELRRFLPKSVVIEAEPSEIQQVVMNLVTNSGQAMPNGGRVDLGLDILSADAPKVGGDETVQLVVRDTGIGMDQRILDRAFDPFFTTKEVGRGTGLGLSVVHGIVTSLGGAIEIQSEAGKGTEVRITLPRSRLPETAEEDMGEPARGRGELILLVDDEDQICRSESVVLEALGYRVITAGSVSEAVALATRHAGELALVITDLTMPGGTGIDLTRVLRENGSAPPIILCTGFDEQPAETEALAVRVLKKPLSVRTLALEIRRAIGS